MTEIRKNKNELTGLFTIKPFSKGELMIEDTSIFNTINIDEKSILKKSCQRNLTGKQYGMLKAAESFAKMRVENQESESELLELYHPNLSKDLMKEEEEIVKLAKETYEIIKKYSSIHSFIYKYLEQTNQNENAEEKILKIMLIWSCNAFEDGLIFPTVSRVNHSCSPNSIYFISKNNTIKLYTCQDLKNDEEITISYLGLFTLSSQCTRKSLLKQDKFFLCACLKCTNSEEEGDLANQIPCLNCHARYKRMLPEEVSYDEVDVFYMRPKYTPETSYHCIECQTTFKNDDNKLQGLNTLMTELTSKITLRMRQSALSTQQPKDDEEEEEVRNYSEEQYDEQLLQTCTSIFGSKHWCTNFMLLTFITRLLSKLHSTMILENEPPDLEDLAEVIDSYQTFKSFVVSLNNSIPAPFFLIKPTIGIARCLISLGDDKSKKYALEFLNFVKDYVQMFESETMCMVMNGLFDAAASSLNDSKGPIHEKEYEHVDKKIKSS